MKRRRKSIRSHARAAAERFVPTSIEHRIREVAVDYFAVGYSRGYAARQRLERRR